MMRQAVPRIFLFGGQWDGHGRDMGVAAAKWHQYRSALPRPHSPLAYCLMEINEMFREWDFVGGGNNVQTVESDEGIETHSENLCNYALCDLLADTSSLTQS
jgi:hypothetical protein